MVLLEITPAILSALEHSPNALDPPLQHTPPTLGAPISHTQLIQLSRVLRSEQKDPPHTLSSLLRGSQVYVAPPPPKPAPSAEYLALKASLLAAQEQAAYNSMLPRRRTANTSILKSWASTTSNNSDASSFSLNDNDNNGIDGHDHHGGGGGDNDNDDDISVSLVLNIFLSVVLCAFTAFWATRYWSSAPARVALSLGTAVAVGLAEAGVYAAYLRRVALSRREERRKRTGRRERKVPVEGSEWRSVVRDHVREGEGKPVRKRR